MSKPTAVITGGGSGIGKAIALDLHAAGYQVLIGGRRESVLQETSKGLAHMLSHSLDVTDRESVKSFMNFAREKFTSVQVLVNSAGINIPERSIKDLKPQDWDRLIAINATGAYNCINEIIPDMREQKDGLIVNISSVCGKRAKPVGGVAYAASKFAMAALGTAVGAEEGENNIRVTNIFPGEVDAPVLFQRPGTISDDFKNQILKPEDISKLVTLIAQLPSTAHVPELVIKPTSQPWI